MANSLRYFPEVNGKNLHHFSVAGSNYVVASGNDGLYYYDGTLWHSFAPPFPAEAKISYIKAFSPVNIWVFYQKRNYDFHTKCFHFNGDKWESVPMPQLSDLEHFSFLDTHRFFAAGHWGSLIYFDGTKAKNIKNCSGVCFSFIEGFRPSLFYAAFRPYESKNIAEMYKVENGRWKKLFELDANIASAHFYNPDSGIVLDGGVPHKYLYKFYNHKLEKTDSLSPGFGIELNDSLFFYYENHRVWRHNLTSPKPLFQIDIPVSVIPLNDKEFLLRSDYDKLLYWGDKKTGQPLKAQKPLYFKRYWFGMDGGGFMGSALYKNRDGRLEVYYTAVTDNNMFIRFSDTTNYKVNKDVLLPRNLLGFGKQDRPEVRWDAGVYFADLDNDGDKDAILSAFRGGCQLYENIGNDRFENVTALYKFNINGRIKEIRWIDLNNDGLLDFMAGVGGGALRIFLNQGFFRFKDMSHQNIIPDSLRSFQPALADVDNDGDLDLFLYSSYEPIRYFENQTEQGKDALPVFVDRSVRSPQLTTRFDFFPQSVSFADYDNDGDLDLLLVNRVTPLKLFENDGNGVFSDISLQKGFHYHFLAYGSNWGDLDQDGFQDIFISAVGKNYIFWNMAGRYFRIDSTSLAANRPTHSAGSILHDMDNDGDLDIIVANNHYGYSEIQENRYNGKNYIKVEFVNGNYVGTRLWVYAQGRCGDKNFLKGFREISLNTGFCSSTFPEAYFGLPADSSYDILIRYPSGMEQKLESLSAGKTYKVADLSSNHNLINQMVFNIQSILYNTRQRRNALNILLFVILILLLNGYAQRKYMWALFPTLFFNLSLISIYFFSRILSAQTSGWFQNYIPLYGVLITGVVLFYLINRYNRLLLKDEHYFELFDLLRQFNHSKNGLKYIDHLLFLSNNMHSAGQEKILTEFQFFIENTLPLLRNLNQFYARLYQKNMLRKNIISLRKTLKKSLNHSPVLPATINRLNRELKQLKKILAVMRRNVETLFNTDIISGLTSSVNRFPQFTRVSFQNESGRPQLLALIPDKDFTQIMGNILQNALEAMDGQQEKPVTIAVNQKDNVSVQLHIRDYGKGLPAAHIEKLFAMGKSTKNSTGLGLYHSRKLLEPFGGKIELHSAAAGKGTEVILDLRLYDENNHFDD